MRLFDILLGRKKQSKTRDYVSYTDEAVTRTRSDGVQESVRWDELEEVGILTTDEGPFGQDVFLCLISMDKRSGCLVPQLCQGFGGLLERLQKLPDFDNEAFVKAMGSTSIANFLCWKRKAT